MYEDVYNISKNPEITMAKQLHVMNNKLFWHFLVIQD